MPSTDVRDIASSSSIITHRYEDHKDRDKEKTRQKLCLGCVVQHIYASDTTGHESSTEDQQQIDKNRSKNRGLYNIYLVFLESDAVSVSERTASSSIRSTRAILFLEPSQDD